MGDPENPAELWPESPEGVEVVNRYFEPTPLEWFTGIITEEGGLSIRNAAARAERASIDRELLHALEALRGRIK
jgi:translation initiation factor 2B subunit (eIF-2B alpha/beta/delta family)